MSCRDSYAEKIASKMEKFFTRKNFIVARSSEDISLVNEGIVVELLITDTEIEIEVPSFREFNDPYQAFRFAFSYEKGSRYFQVSPFIAEEDYNKSFLSLRYSLPIFQPHDMVREVATVDFLVQEALRYIREDKKLIDQVVNKYIRE